MKKPVREQFLGEIAKSGAVHFANWLYLARTSLLRPLFQLKAFAMHKSESNTFFISNSLILIIYSPDIISTKVTLLHLKVLIRSSFEGNTPVLPCYGIPAFILACRMKLLPAPKALIIFSIFTYHYTIL